MEFKIKEEKWGKPKKYKTLYISQELLDEIDKIADENKTTANNVLVNMIEFAYEYYKKN